MRLGRRIARKKFQISILIWFPQTLGQNSKVQMRDSMRSFWRSWREENWLLLSLYLSITDSWQSIGLHLRSLPHGGRFSWEAKLPPLLYSAALYLSVGQSSPVSRLVGRAHRRVPRVMESNQRAPWERGMLLIWGHRCPSARTQNLSIGSGNK